MEGFEEGGLKGAGARAAASVLDGYTHGMATPLYQSGGNVGAAVKQRTSAFNPATYKEDLTAIATASEKGNLRDALGRTVDTVLNGADAVQDGRRLTGKSTGKSQQETGNRSSQSEGEGQTPTESPTANRRTPAEASPSRATPEPVETKSPASPTETNAPSGPQPATAAPTAPAASRPARPARPAGEPTQPPGGSPTVERLDPTDPQAQPPFRNDEKVPQQGRGVSSEEVIRREVIMKPDGTVVPGAQNPLDSLGRRESVVQINRATGTTTVIHGPDVPDSQKAGIRERLLTKNAEGINRVQSDFTKRQERNAQAQEAATRAERALQGTDSSPTANGQTPAEASPSGATAAPTAPAEPRPASDKPQPSGTSKPAATNPATSTTTATDPRLDRMQNQIDGLRNQPGGDKQANANINRWQKDGWITPAEATSLRQQRPAPASPAQPAGKPTKRPGSGTPVKPPNHDDK